MTTKTVRDPTSGQNVNNQIVVDQSQDASDTINNGSNRASVLTELVSNLSSTVQSVQQSVTTLNNRVNNISRNVVQTGNAAGIQTTCVRSSEQSMALSQSSEVSYSLQTAYTAMNRNASTIRNRPAAAAGSEAQARDIVDRGQYVRTAYGYSAVITLSRNNFPSVKTEHHIR